MRPTVLEAFCLLGMLAAGVVLVSVATLQPDGFPAVGSWVSLLGFFTAMAVAVGALRWKGTRTPGFLALTGGLALVAVGAGLSLLGSVSFPSWLGDQVSPGSAALLARSTGAVGIAFGFVFWVNGLIRRAGEAEELRERLRVEVTRLEEQVRSQGEQLRQALTIDEVTGALNRRPFLERLDDTIRRDARLGKSLAFLLVSVPSVNILGARGGRRASETALHEVSQVLQGATRGTDLVGRLGQDLFAVTLGECADPRPAVNRTLSALDAAPRFGPTSEPLTVRIAAVTVRKPDLSLTFADLISCAESILGKLPEDGESHWAGTRLETDTASRAASG